MNEATRKYVDELDTSKDEVLQHFDRMCTPLFWKHLGVRNTGGSKKVFFTLYLPLIKN